MRLSNIVGVVISAFFLSGCGAAWKAPEPFSKKIDAQLLELVTKDEISVFIAKDKYHSINTSKDYDDIYYNYSYNFSLDNDMLVGKMSGECSLARNKRTLDHCYDWNLYKPANSFLEDVEKAKAYYASDEIFNKFRNFKSIKPKVEACQNKINATVKLKDETGILGSNVDQYFTPTVQWNKGVLNNYMSVDSSNFTCAQLQDTFNVNINSSNEFMFNNKTRDYYTLNVSSLTSAMSLPSYLIKSLQYQFFKNDYTISDKYIKVTMQYGENNGYYSKSDSIIPTVSVENLTGEFLELQGVTIYYGSNASEYLGSADSHIDISPETSSKIISNKVFILNGLKPKYVPIKSLQDTIKIGLAIKYKIKSTNQIQTLYKTEMLGIKKK